MDTKKALGTRTPFRTIVGSSVPVLLVSASHRWGVVIVNEGSTVLKVGTSGTVSATGIGVPASQSLSDTFSSDEYWGLFVSSSGTVSGFYVPA